MPNMPNPFNRRSVPLKPKAEAALLADWPSAPPTAALATLLAVASAYFFAAYWKRDARARRRSRKLDKSLVATPYDADFERASEHVNKIRDQLPMKERLRLYSYYKQGTCGDAPAEGPPAYLVIDHTKWSSWSRRRGRAPADAKAKYISIVHELQLGHMAAAAGTAATAAVEPAPFGDGASTLATESALRARIVELEATLARMTKQIKQTRGWLNRYKPDAASWLGSSASRWDRRFFVLTRDAQGALQLHYYPTETALVPDERLPLSNCVVIDEGTKQSRGAQFHIFSVWLKGTLHSERGPGSGALLRASCADEREANKWLEALAEATGSSVRTLDAVQLSPAPSHQNLAAFEFSPPVRWGVPLSSAEGGAPPSATSSAPVAAVTAQPVSATSPAANAVPLSARPRPPPIEMELGAAPGVPPLPPPDAPGEPTTPGGTRKPRAFLDPNLFPASRPMHRTSKPSLLSGGGFGSDPSGEHANLSGFVNLVFLLFVVTNFRLLLENLLLNGLLVTLPSSTDLLRDAEAILDRAALQVKLHALLRTAAVLAVPILCAFGLERAAVQRTPFSRFSRRFVDPLHAINVGASLAMPAALVGTERHYGGAGGGVLLLICSVTIFLKLVSWAHVHHDLREAGEESRGEAEGSLDARLAKYRSTVSDTDGASLHYPSNVTFGNLLWFLVAPTLCYQLDYPRTPRVRKTYLISLVLRTIMLWTLLPAFVVQYMLPLLDTSIEPIMAGDVARILERLLRLAVPVTYVWLIGFYAFFHVWLNLLAELTRFGDRVFYKAWWNAIDFEGYWRTWNMPVHMWVVRHAFFPIQRHVTSSKVLTGLLCFTLSAVLHEIVVAFPLHSYRMPLAFVGMMSQVPMLPLSKLLRRYTQGTAFEQAGNFLFWVTFCFVGQPLCVLLYYVHATQAVHASAT